MSRWAFARILIEGIIRLAPKAFSYASPPQDGLTYSLPLLSASRLNPSMSLASLRLHSPWRTWGSAHRTRLPSDNQARKAHLTFGPFCSIVGVMPQSLSRAIVHIIFITKDREHWRDLDVRPRMHAYLATLCRDLAAEVVCVGRVVAERFSASPL